MNKPLKIVSPHAPTGDQPEAIEALVRGLESGAKHQVLLGVTGSGKTFTIANVIERFQRPTLVLAHNKTLAAQLYSEFKALFPENAVHYFVSYYDYYQPEAYVPATDTFIEKDSRINEEIDRMRHAATKALIERRDVIIVASVSCIYGIGSVKSYSTQQIHLHVGDEMDRDELLAKLVDILYERNDYDYHRGTFRVRGDTIEVFPVSEEDEALRIEFFGDEIDAISRVDPMRGRKLESLEEATIFPASHYVVEEKSMREALVTIREELYERLAQLNAEGRLLEAQRLEQRTFYDLEQLEQFGRCNGIEHYSRHFTGVAPGDPPPCLLDYFPANDWLMVVDESHVTLPQVGGMYRGDRSRKMNLVEYGFRLPSALDNRPLKFEEFEERQSQVIYVSATPGAYELDKTEGIVVEQIIRPTGLLDPLCELRPAQNQVDALLGEVQATIANNQRVLVTTLTKRMAEDLADYFAEIGIKVRYLHADIDTLERTAILRDLRLGEFDVLIGINLLREGLDLPEVGLVAILDADKEGFLRNRTSLIQTIGRAARNAEGHVILYADKVTQSIQQAMDETADRRARQAKFNEEHGIVPRTIIKPIFDGPSSPEEAAAGFEPDPLPVATTVTLEDLQAQAKALRKEMQAHAKALEFEEAAKARDALREVEKKMLELG